MTEQALTTTTNDADRIGAMVQMVEDSVSSPSTKRNYRRALVDFLKWYRETGQGQLSKAVVQRYSAHLVEDLSYSAANVNQRLSAIRKLAREAADNGAIPEALGTGIARVAGIRSEGHRVGNWLTKTDAEQLLDAPPRDTLRGKRDRAMLATFVGCGLRRQELASLTFEHIQQRDGRWCLVDLVGKRNKRRTVPMPSFAKALIDTWATAAGIGSAPEPRGRVFRPIVKGGARLSGAQLSSQAAYNAVRFYVEALGLGKVAPHDLRRTYAKLCHKGGSPIEQIQLSLGHASVQTTERYLGVEQDLTDAPCDRLGLCVEL